MLIRNVIQKIFKLKKQVFNRFLSLSSKMKVIVIAIIILFFGGIYFLKTINGNRGYIVEPVKRASIKEVVSDSGKIISGGSVDVYSPTKGFITELFVENGQTVKENDNLFTVKSSATTQEQETAYSTYLSAVSTLKASESLAHSLKSSMYTKWKTYFDLATNDTYEKSDGVPNEVNRNAAEFQSAKEDWLATERKVIDQDTAVAANRAAVAAAWTAYQTTQTTTIKAELPGLVRNLSVSLGNSVGVLSVLTPNVAPVLKIAAETKPEAVLAVGQTNIAKVKIGQKTLIHPDPYKDKNFEGVVIRIDDLGQNIAGVVTYNVYVEINNSNELLRSEMTVDGDIITNEKNDVLAVPNSAIVLYKDGKAVRATKGNSLEYLPVKTGIKGETITEILEGVSEGQKIIVALTNEKVKRPSLLGL